MSISSALHANLQNKISDAKLERNAELNEKIEMNAAKSSPECVRMAQLDYVFGFVEENPRQSALNSENCHKIKVELQQCSECLTMFQNRHECTGKNKKSSQRTSRHSFLCDFCDTNFLSRKIRKEHELVHTSKPQEICPKCQKPVPGAELKQHFLDHNKRFRCTICNVCFDTKGRLHAHKKTHERKPMYKCSNCPDIFYKKVDLLKHEKIHTKADRYFCGSCDHEAVSRHQLKLHLLSHTEEKPFHCIYCPDQFLRRPSILNHLRESHSGQNDFIRIKYPGEKKNETEKKVNCSVCGKAFKENGINKHFRKIHKLVVNFLTEIENLNN